MREWIFPAMFVVFAVILEMVNFLTLGIGVLPTYFLFDLAVIAIFLGILFLIPTGSKGWICLASFFLLIQVSMNIVNDTIYNVFGDVFSLSMLNLGHEGFNAFRFEFLDFGIILLNIAIFVGFIVIACYLRKNLDKVIILTKKGRIAVILAMFLSFQILGTSLFVSSINVVSATSSEVEQKSVTTDEELWNNMFLKTESIKRFGTYGFYLKNLSNYIFSDGKMSDETRKIIENYLASGQSSLAMTNDMTGVGAGDNLIVIMLESFDNFAIDPIFTPYLYSIKNGTGIAKYYDNFYARNKTNISEEISLLGHIPNDKLLSGYNSSVGLTTPYSLPNLYKANASENSAVNYFHGYTKKFYDRENVNVALGFENVYAIEDCTLENKTKEFNDWILDSEYIDNMMDEFIPENKQFFSFYTTITTHGAYDYNNKHLTDNLEYVNANFGLYEEYIDGTGEFSLPQNKKDLEILKHFKSACMDTDKMVQKIFERLAELNILDTTTVVMYADHNCYYSNLCYKMKNIAKDSYENTELYHLPMIIYNDAIGGGVDHTFCNTYDIYPTICDLLGIEYNTTLTQGYSLFSSDIEKSVFVSSLSGMYTDKLFTNNIDDVVMLDNSLTAEDVEVFKSRIVAYYKKQEYIELIYRYNYFKDVARK